MFDVTMYEDMYEDQSAIFQEENNTYFNQLLPIIRFTITPIELENETIFYSHVMEIIYLENVFLTLDEKVQLQYNSNHIYQYCKRVDHIIGLDNSEFTFILFLGPDSENPAQMKFEVDLLEMKNNNTYPSFRGTLRQQ
jgi:hypothetical protein